MAMPPPFALPPPVIPPPMLVPPPLIVPEHPYGADYLGGPGAPGDDYYQYEPTQDSQWGTSVSFFLLFIFRFISKLLVMLQIMYAISTYYFVSLI